MGNINEKIIAEFKAKWSYKHPIFQVEDEGDTYLVYARPVEVEGKSCTAFMVAKREDLFVVEMNPFALVRHK